MFSEFNTQMILELVVTLVLVLASLGIRVWVQYGKAKLSEADQQRLLGLANQATLAAEELGSREGWTGAQKLAFVQDTLRKAYPQLDPRIFETVIHGVLAANQLGTAVKKRKA